MKNQPPPCPQRLWALLALGLVWALAGCSTSKPPAKPAPVAAATAAQVDELNLVTMPVAVNLESRPGVDGIAVKVYAVDVRRPKTQPIQSGVLEILMFDGLVRESFQETNRCRHLWSYPASELPAYAFTSTVGTGYAFPLGWGKDRPREDKITVVARYCPPHAPAVYSAPSYIALPAAVPPSPAP